ncbi:hypothetical protein [Actinacidiphila sp. bgisy144]|uniref:hypothetical protein n=1 Tax=Actinacidiphila sp. bgisy144 TaxID=3413791 RepID=UPI003EBD5A80
MSYSLYLIRFEHGDAAAMDGELFDEVIGPHVVKREPEHGFVQIRTEDGGEADLYATANAGPALMSIMVSCFSSGPVLDVVAGLANRLDAAIVLQEGVALVSETDRWNDLPEVLRQDAKVVGLCGDAIQAAINGI